MAGTRADGRKAEIVAAAAELFDRVGYFQASMENIAEAVGIRKPTLYHYLGSKQEILYLIHDGFIDVLLERHERRVGLTLTSSQRLLEVMADIVELMHTHRPSVRVFFEHYRELGEPEMNLIRAKRDRYFSYVEQIVVDAVARGEMRECHPRLVTLAVFGMCNWAYTWYDPAGPLHHREIALAFWDMVMRGLAPPSSP